MAAKPGSERGTVRLGGIEFGRIVRSQLKVDGVERADIKTLMSKDHRAVDFLDQSVARKMSENSLMDARDKNSEVKSKGLILLYPIDPMSEPDRANRDSRDPLNAHADVIGIALVFPGSANDDSKVSQTYVSVDLTDAEIESDDGELVALTGSDG